MRKRPQQTEATKRRIMDAFFDLYKENGIHGVSVTAVTIKASINRSTFYQYFTDIYDLLEQYENMILDEAYDELKAALSKGMPKKLSDYTKLTLEVYAHFSDEIFCLLSPKGDPVFRTKLLEHVQPILKEYFFQGIDFECEKHFDYVLSFALSGSLGAIIQWHEKKDMKIEEILFIIQRLLIAGMQGYFDVTVFEE